MKILKQKKISLYLFFFFFVFALLSSYGESMDLDEPGPSTLPNTAGPNLTAASGQAQPQVDENLSLYLLTSNS